eukprot:TRINITY_DN5713_c0_g2_i1.p1 TRINITY_DN5713_c0_g2~~TRINITY_DN5713_c0_g2_i1.p1  ORF type:complete len:121 (+),score=10.06 TRINITY_DN5713_c0_g2_i1:533-895(+)
MLVTICYTTWRKRISSFVFRKHTKNIMNKNLRTVSPSLLILTILATNIPVKDHQLVFLLLSYSPHLYALLCYFKRKAMQLLTLLLLPFLLCLLSPKSFSVFLGRSKQLTYFLSSLYLKEV